MNNLTQPHLLGMLAGLFLAVALVLSAMLAEATKDAHTRAEQIASRGGRAMNQLRWARMGVFQITPLYSSQTSSEGINDTTSLEKTVTAGVTASFSLK